MEPNRGTPSKWLHVQAGTSIKNGTKQGYPLKMAPYAS